jgi:hypothetical protein
VNRILGRQYGRGAVLTYTGPVGHFSPRSLELLAPRVRVITGHLPFGIDAEIPRACSYITFLREPVARVASLYKYIIDNPKHHLHQLVRHQTLAEFVGSGVNSEEIDNGQTRQIAGIAKGDLTSDALDMAKSNLKEFLIPGIVERFDESLILMKRKLGWKIPVYVKANVSTIETGTMSDDTLRVIRQRTELDIEVYRTAQRLLEESISTGGRSLKTELTAFRLINRAAHIYRIASLR